VWNCKERGGVGKSSEGEKSAFIGEIGREAMDDGLKMEEFAKKSTHRNWIIEAHWKSGRLSERQ